MTSVANGSKLNGDGGDAGEEEGSEEQEYTEMRELNIFPSSAGTRTSFSSLHPIAYVFTEVWIPP